MHRIDFGGKITPAIELTEVKEAPKGGALLIKALDELLFDADFSHEEKIRVLKHLNQFLSETADNPNFPVYLELTSKSADEVCAEISKHLQGSRIAELLIKQEKSKYTIDSFIDHCQHLNIKNLIVGGVYGDGCVWQAAVEFAKNIYAKNLSVCHPNIRYKAGEEGYQFENAVILPEFNSLGKMKGETQKPPFDQFIFFQQLHVVDGSYEDSIELKTDEGYGKYASTAAKRVMLAEHIKKALVSPLDAKSSKSSIAEIDLALFARKRKEPDKQDVSSDVSSKEESKEESKEKSTEIEPANKKNKH